MPPTRTRQPNTSSSPPALGYDPVLDYRVDQLGVMDSYAGALQIEGGWYCPAIPQRLIDATADWQRGSIDRDEWLKRIAERQRYRLRQKESPDAEGHVRMGCPASGHAPTARCDLKPTSISDRTRGRTRIFLTTELTDEPPKICTQQTVTFPPTAGAKLHQRLHYGSEEWHARYGTLRNTIEGFNGTTKDGANEALGDPTRRRIRGVAAQTVFTAFLIFATNLRKITNFLERAMADDDGVQRRARVPRARRRKSKPLEAFHPDATANAPPHPAARG